jgi:hypothetical protein
LREECRLRVFKNMLLRRIFGPKKDEVTGKWRRLHNEGWEDNIKTDLREVGLGGCMDWINLAQDRDRWWVLVNVVMNFWVP